MSDELIRAKHKFRTPTTFDDDDGVVQLAPESDSLLGALNHRKGVMAATCVVTFLGLLAVLPALPRHYKATATIVMALEDEADAQRQAKLPVDVGAIQTQVQIIKSRALLEQVVDKLRLQDDPELNPTELPWWKRPFASDGARRDPMVEVVAALQNRLDIDQANKAYTVEITMRSRDPVKASRIANAIADTYLDNQMRDRRENVRRLTEGLGERMATLQDKARRSRSTYQQFINEFRLVDPAWGASAERTLATLSEELARAIQVSSETSARARALSDMARAGTADGAPEVLNSRIIQMLKERELKISNSNRIGITELELSEIRRDTDNEINRIVRAAQTEAAVAQGREARIKGEIERLRASLAERTRLEVRLTELRKEMESDEAVLQDAAIRFKSQTNALALLNPDTRMVSPAVAPVKPSFPQVPLFLAGALAAALIAGLGAGMWSHAMGPGRRARHRLA